MAENEQLSEQLRENISELERTLDEEKNKRWSVRAAELIRAVIRPALALSSWGATIAFLATRITIPDAWWALVAAISTFYFVHRHEEKRERAEKEKAWS